ncbi:Hypothetical_protein [Hexamita inflata]|uniref:Hypothetical_protein n=1 Tax=Hexamita inflata TaxID=28002 RepID=A0AA86RW29_9EUKA|nr:Hypothetical protein HINF_LOCUS66564 [Hexamita inflata]
MWYILQGKCLTSVDSSSEKVDQVWTHYWKAIELNVVSSIKVFHILTKMCRGVILLQLQVMLLSDGSVTCLRTQELTIEFMVVPHGINHNGPLYLQLIVLQIMQKTVHILHFEKILRIPLVFRCSEHSTRSFAQHLSDTHRYTKKFSNIQLVVSGSFEQSSNFPIYAFRQVLALSQQHRSLTEFGQETRYRCQRHGNSTKGLVFFSYDSSSSNLWLWRYLTTRKSQLSQIF